MIVRGLWVVGGLICVGLGALGAVVPGLPSTVFFIGAAACFTRSSPRLERWVLGLPGVGALVRDHRAGLGMPRRAKWWVMACIAAFSAVAVALDPGAAVAAVVVVLAVVGIAVVGWRVPTRERVLAGDLRPRRP
ncbi:MAG: YbaN family protein [Acidimicrobiia bacterium]